MIVIPNYNHLSLFLSIQTIVGKINKSKASILKLKVCKIVCVISKIFGMYLCENKHMVQAVSIKVEFSSIKVELINAN